METTRAKVIETAVGFEESISQLLSLLLEIEKDKSISFGNKNMALSFTSKINLLVDLKFIPKEISSDFQIFAEIRNKFAHVAYVDSFIKCFELIPDKKNNFLKKMSDDISQLDKNDEAIYESCFDLLCWQLSIWLRVTLKMISNKQSQDLKRVGAIEMIRSFLQSDKAKREKELESFTKTIQPIIDQIIPDEDFMNEYNKLVEENKQSNVKPEINQNQKTN
ncbi:hypothetical protein OD917_00055 [Flavobacterium sp. SH_e]|uniref:hypothetical protein n=1 Tax=Flavobacterium sp. SH_e TaxID=2983767 RepID=UPI0021E3CA2D|nr:hypothetical protein [Flavobacterium sp. SH_e]MCV2483298.1 hypothetical protein [Flavobacterium sp. SH_e]